MELLPESASERAAKTPRAVAVSRTIMMRPVRVTRKIGNSISGSSNCTGLLCGIEKEISFFLFGHHHFPSTHPKPSARWRKRVLLPLRKRNSSKQPTQLGLAQLSALS